MNWQFERAGQNHGWFTEGPVWDGTKLLFTHVPTSRILTYDPQTDSSEVYLEGTNNANGLAIDSLGRLYACEGGARRVVLYQNDGNKSVVANGFDGRRLNIPNDIIVDSSGKVWFTDPYYGAAVSWVPNEENQDLTHCSVYRVDPQQQGWNSAKRVTFDTSAPNGLLFSLDENTLFVAESSADIGGDRQLRSYPIDRNGHLGQARILYNFGNDRPIDGMCLDSEGNIFATAGSHESGPGPSIWVFSEEGEIIERHPVPEAPTNCAFGDVDLRTLYVTTATGDLLMARTEYQGIPNR